MKPRNEGSAWVDRFPDATRRTRRVNVDHGPDEPGLLRKLITGIGIACAFVGACIVILIVMGLLKALGVKEL